MSLTVRNLRFSYGKRRVLKDIDFEIRSGCLTAVMGQNGSGKTTLLKNIDRILKPETGSVLVDDAAVATMSGSDIARNIGYVPQRQETACCTVFEAVLLGRKLRSDGTAGRNELDKVEEILRLVHLENLAMRPTTEISGGELQKVILARALAQEPKVLLLDEPTNHLDPVNQIEVMSLLHAITKSLNIASLLVTHDLSNALRFADQFILLKDGNIFACGDKQVVTPDAVREVFHIEAIIEEVAGVPVVIPLLREVRSHEHYHVHEHQHDGSKHPHRHMHTHSHEVDDHIYDHDHSNINDVHSQKPTHNHVHNGGKPHE
jgi:iron complex transport system ATP-binding protein